MALTDPRNSPLRFLLELEAGEAAGNLLFLYGKAGSGKRTLARRIAGNAPCLLLNMERCTGLNEQTRLALSIEWVMDTALSGGLPCAENYTPEWESLLRMLTRDFAPEMTLMVLSGSPCQPPILDGREELELSPAEIRSVAQTALTVAGESNISWAILEMALQNELEKAGKVSLLEKTHLSDTPNEI